MAAPQGFRKRQHALARFGAFVLDNEDLQTVLDEACRIIAETLGTDYAKVIEIDQASQTGLVRAGFGWQPGVVGNTRIDMGERSSEAFAVAQGVPVVTNDIAQEHRFHYPDFLLDHGVVAMVNVPVLLPGRKPWGLLQVDARERKEFDEEDIEFLQTYAMILGPVVDRLEIADDVSERKKAQQRQAVLLAELQHRVRNNLAVVRSMLRWHSQEHQSAEDFLAHLDGRIGALVRTQVLLTRAQDGGVDLAMLIREELSSHAAHDRVKIQGPDVKLPPRATEVLSLVMHELTTNSLKFGGLSQAGARIEILWDLQRRDQASWLRLRWSESRVLMAQTAPARQGFGTELITRRIQYELRGTGTMDLRADGMTSTLEFPLEERASVLQTNGLVER